MIDHTGFYQLLKKLERIFFRSRSPLSLPSPGFLSRRHPHPSQPTAGPIFSNSPPLPAVRSAILSFPELEAAISLQSAELCRHPRPHLVLAFQFWDDFERTGLSSLISVRVRDIQGEGFPSEFAGLADAVFLDLPQPWLAIPSAAEMLKQDGTLCSFSPCVEQVQRSCETLQNSFTDIRTFEVLLRTYEVREGKMENLNGDNNGSNGSLPCKRRQRSNGSYAPDSIVSSIMARPCGEARGHTGYLTFARLKWL